MKRLSLGRFFKYFFTFVLLFFIFQTGAAAPAHAADSGQGQISGNVTEEGTANPIAGLMVNASDYQTNEWGGSAQTQVTTGTYTITGLTPGTYRVQVNTRQPDVFWVEEFYDNTQDWNAASPVTVEADATTSGINFGLSPGGKIRGYVMDKVTGDPIGYMLVCVNSVSGSFGACILSDVNGYYETPGLPFGSYKLNVSPRELPYVAQWYDNSPTSNAATSVDVLLANYVTEDKNFFLSTGAGQISGLVTGGVESTPVPNVNVIAFDMSNTWINSISTGSDGAYTISGLTPGQYKVQVNTSGSGTDYVSQYYANIPSFSQATPVNVTAGETMPGINFVLATGGSITGTVTQDGTAVGIAGLQVQATYFNSNEWAGSAQTQVTTGTYTITGLPSGQYRVQVNTSGSGTDYISEYYDNVLSSNLATPVDVTAGETMPGINFGLATGGSITGTVTEDGTTPAEPIAGLWVTATNFNSNDWGGSAQTQVTTGTYTITGLTPGTYRVQVNTRQPDVFWVEEFYDNTQDWNAASPVTVEADATTSGINFGLSPGGKISGYVRDEAGAPISNMSVNVNSNSGSWGAGMQSQADGHYETPCLPPGSYTLSVQPPPDQYYLSEWYNNSPTSNGAASVTVVLDQVIQNIDFSLTSVGRITGLVTREADRTPIQGIAITVVDFATGVVRTTVYTGSDGTYSIDILPGNYRILAASSAYDFEFYNATTYDDAASVAVAAGLTTANIDFALALGGGTGGTISFAGTLKDKNGTAIDPVTVAVVGADPAITTTTDASGAFNLPGLPAGNPFVFKFSKEGYLPTYSAALNSNTGLQGNYTLFAAMGDVNALWTSQGAIWGRVDNRNDNSVNVGGATVVATSTFFPGTTYPVYYCEDSGNCRTDLGTYDNGRFLIPDVPEDTVIVQAFKDGWSFDPRTFRIFTDGVATSRVHGINTPSNVSFTGYVKDNFNAALPDVAVQMVGNDAVTATTDGFGYFNMVGGLPNNAGFYMRYSKTGYIPVYTASISSTGPINTPLTSATLMFQNGHFPVVSGKSAITGVVVNRTTGAPVGGAVVTLDSAKSPSGNAYVVNYCDNAGGCSAAPSGTYSNGVFVVFNVDAGDAIVVRAEKNGWDFYDCSLVTFADAITEMTIRSAMAITPLVENYRTSDGNYYTYLDITIENSFTGTLPVGITAIIVTGPDGNVIPTKPDFTYSSEFRDFWVRLPGQPALGDYTFTVTGNGMTVTGADVQFINRNLPVPDKNTFSYTPGATPTFTWPALDYTECPLYYRLIINNIAGTRVYNSNRVLGMLSHTVTAVTLEMGQTYQFQVRASDSSDGVKTQNSSRSDWVTFTVQEPGVITINPEPDDMNTTAPWTLTGPYSYSRSGTGDTTLIDLHSGDYILTWGDVSGWTKPSPASSIPTPLAAGGTITFTGTYTLIPQTGTVVINPEPAAMNATAPWTLTGPNSYSRTGAGDLTLNNLALGSYTITWGDVSGWIKTSPVTETKALISGVTTTFSGSYVHQTIPVIQVTPVSLNFGYVPVGSTKDLFLTVRNTGSGTLTGIATTAAPFSIVSGGSYSLGQDLSQVVTIRYQPTSPGPHTGAVVMTGGAGATVPVTGKTEKPLGLPWLLLLLN